MKNSTSKKLNIFRTSPLISAVALVEVIVLLCVSTFAWFVFSENNKLESDVITVETDSGLDIDFSEASEEDFINIRNYINDFSFEPVTSLDGRNIFVPTTGTLNSTDTNKIVFREATVNDMNSKYINIDFELKNTTDEETKVYLSSKSYFNVSDTSGKAMRLAFYQNDGSQGAISGDMDTTPGGDDSSDDGDDTGDTQNTYYIFFDTTGACGENWTGYQWNEVWVETDWTALISGNINSRLKLKHLEGNIYYLNIQNLLDEYAGATTFSFMKFYCRSDSPGDSNTYLSTQLEADSIEANSQYGFILDNGVATVKDSGDHQGLYLQKSEYTGKIPSEGGEDDGESGGSSGGGNTEDDSGDTVDATTVYFYNSEGWTKPHIFVSKSSDNNSLKDWPGYEMKKVSGNIYYFTFNSAYDLLKFSDGTSVESNSYRTVQKGVQNGHIYSLIGLQQNSTKVYEVTSTNYEGTYGNGTYPVICPGVSTGFKEPYAPVVAINDANGDATSVVPAFASSIDEYSYSEDNSPLFTIRPSETISLSMIIWLEGTDDYCTNETYAGKKIDINIVFATGESDEKLYTYRFIDQTKECWIVDNKEENGLTYKPVMQLYDADNNKGYRMKTTTDTREVYNNEGELVSKPYVWEVQAPADLIDSSKIMFRRVNPNNENEVWNYWDAGEFINADDSLVENVVSFTAFADGSPTNVSGSTTPALSCGGLWGAHNVELLTICDATKEENNPSSNGYLEIDNGILTINFTHEDRTIEYKASGPSNDFYYFMVPDFIMDKNDPNRPSVQFKRYYNVDKEHALNSAEYQTNIKFDSDSFNSWGSKVGQCCGKYFSVNQTKGGTFNNYWGEDIIYVQASDGLGTQMDRSDSFWQVRFYADSKGSDSGTSKYAYLYRNYADTFNAFRTYPCVVPSDAKYYYYRVEQCNSNNVNERWNRTELIEINEDTTTGSVQYYSNTVDDDKVICKMESLTHTLFFQMSSTYCSSTTNVPYLYAYKGSDDNDWPGLKMTEVSISDTSLRKYKAEVNISKYDSAIFSTPNVVALAPGDTWNNGGAWFAAYFYKSSNQDDYKWVKGEWIDNVVKVAAPIGYDKVIWCRMAKDTSECSWNNKWNQTFDLDVPSADSTNKQYNITGWGGDNNAYGVGNWAHNDSRLKSETLAIGSASDRNGMIILGEVVDGHINLTKLKLSDGSVWVEDGFDSTESISYDFYSAPNWP